MRSKIKVAFLIVDCKESQMRIGIATVNRSFFIIPQIIFKARLSSALRNNIHQDTIEVQIIIFYGIPSLIALK